MTIDTLPRGRVDQVLVALCVTEIVSWGVLYYSLPAASGLISRITGWSPIAVTGAFSAGLLLSAVLGIFVGRALDRFGPRVVMTLGSIIGVIGVLTVSVSTSISWFVAAWLVIGVAQSAVLYQPAFTVIARHYGDARNRPLLIVTLVAGLASTVFVPLTTALDQAWGWRISFAALAGILALVTIPLHAVCLPKGRPTIPRRTANADRERIVRTRRFILLQLGITLIAFGLYAVTINLIPLLASRGASVTLAAIGLGSVGVGQLLGRLVLTFLMTRISTRTRPFVVGLGGAIVLVLLGEVPGPLSLLLLIGLLAGSVRGALTLVQATAVVDRWGQERLGVLNGAFAAPVTIATALAPVAGVLLAEHAGGYAPAAAIFGGVVLVGAILAARR
jgi:MFS family permease